VSIVRVFEVEPKARVALPGLGLAEFDGRGGVRFDLKGRELHLSLLDAGVVSRALITLWSDAATGTVLIHQHQGVMCVAAVRLRDGAVSMVPVYHDARLETGLWHAEFVETPLGPVLVYELGVIAFDSDGAVRWRAEHPSIQWVYLGVEGDEVVFDNEFEGQWRYRLEDGRKRVLGPC
jgi:hypothetical protein